jgi:hydroxymethylbilane synthase
MKHTIKIATRKSPLALWQAYHVQTALLQLHPQLNVQILEMTTKGDKILDAPLAKIGGKGLFVKELEHSLLQAEADIAVHSMKDVPVEFPPGLHLPVIMRRENPQDAFVSANYDQINDLPQGAIVGTSSLRRQAQLLALRPDLQIRSLRGNVGTRLNKLDQGEYAAIILAAAGLTRLNQNQRIKNYIPTEIILPAIGQGAIGIECRTEDEAIHSLIAPLNHFATQQCVLAERAINQTLAGGCQVPIAGLAQIQQDKLTLKALVASPDGSKILRSQAEADIMQAATLGLTVAKDLLTQGADKILAALVEPIP